MTESDAKITYLEARIGVLEEALSGLIQGELATLTSYGSDRFYLLNLIHNQALQNMAAAEADYQQAKQTNT